MIAVGCGQKKGGATHGTNTRYARGTRCPFFEPLFIFFTRCWFRWTLCRYVYSSKPFEQKLEISSERKKTRKTLMFQFDDSCFSGEKLWDNRVESFINDVCIRSEETCSLGRRTFLRAAMRQSTGPIASPLFNAAGPRRNFE